METTDLVLAAVADRTRRAILKYLNSEPHTAGELASRFAVSWPAISRHLRLLRNAGLVTVEHSGRTRRYFLNPSVLRGALNEVLTLAGAGFPSEPAGHPPAFIPSSFGREAVS